MKSKKLKQELDQLGQALKTDMAYRGQKDSMKISGLNQTDISLFMSNKRKWSYEKLVRIAGRFGL